LLFQKRKQPLAIRDVLSDKEPTKGDLRHCRAKDHVQQFFPPGIDT
jgi:hypothetical protein